MSWEISLLWAFKGTSTCSIFNSNKTHGETHLEPRRHSCMHHICKLSLCLFLTQTALFKILCLSQGLTSPSSPKTTIFISFCSPHTLTHMHILSEGEKWIVDIVVKNTKLRYFKKIKANLLLTHSSQTDPVEKTPSGLW